MIIFDLDGTLADCDHRRHFVDPDKNPDYEMTLIPDGHVRFLHKETGYKFKPDYQAFYEACDKDTPIKSVCQVLWSLQSYDMEIEIWSGRCESVRSKTEFWISENIAPMSWSYAKLKMRPIGDYIPDDQLKERWLDEELAKGNKIEMVFDDRKKVRDMWIRRGIFVFDVSQGKGDF